MKLLLQTIVAVMPQHVRIFGIPEIDLEHGPMEANHVCNIGG